MKKRLFWLFPALLLWSGCGNGEKNTPHEILLCGDKTALIVDANASDSTDVKILWRWDVDDAREEIPAEYFERFRNLDECKFVDEGRKILITCGGGGVALIDRETKKVLFTAYAPMAHSADLLPGNRIAVALSIHEAGNAVEIYDIARSDEVLFRDTLYSGHGSVWMEERGLYYALGYYELREYQLLDWESETPRLQCVRTWKLSDECGHDLCAISDHELLVTAHGVSLFDIESETFTPFAPLADAGQGVKAVNYNPVTENLVYTKALGGEAWWTFDVVMKNPDRIITIPEIKIYKARPHPVVKGAVMK